ncbi:hypothetical protein [Dyella subtropica]|uniref:hypothetical protein n=1 Tax=Dyella subtropica TaxID=2992127 RepID=UPI002259055D|nr:hypothetical protein [Dyella subtropica]
MSLLRTRIIATLIVALFPMSQVAAYDWVATGHVVDLEATYLPGLVVFTLDVQAGANSCHIFWNGSSAQPASAQADNVKAVYATLLAAKVSGQKITVYGSNPSTTDNTSCEGNFIHVAG